MKKRHFLFILLLLFIAKNCVEIGSGKPSDREFWAGVFTDYRRVIQWPAPVDTLNESSTILVQHTPLVRGALQKPRTETGIVPLTGNGEQPSPYTAFPGNDLLAVNSSSQGSSGHGPYADGTSSESMAMAYNNPSPAAGISPVAIIVTGAAGREQVAAMQPGFGVAALGDPGGPFGPPGDNDTTGTGGGTGGGVGGPLDPPADNVPIDNGVLLLVMTALGAGTVGWKKKRNSSITKSAALV